MIFAKSLFWVPWTWFLPLLVALLFGHKLFSSVNKVVIVGAAFFVTFSIKFLCGYDYMTTVVLCSIAPVIYYGAKFDEPLRAIAARVVGVGLVACLAFAFSISLQVSRIADDFFAGLSTVWLDAQKRTLATANVGDLAKASCAHLTNAAENKDCIDTTVAPHKASVVGVVMIYLAFRDFLPWLNGPGYDLDQSAASAVKKAVSRLDFREAVSIIEKLDRHRTVGALVTIFQCLAGLAN